MWPINQDPPFPKVRTITSMFFHVLLQVNNDGCESSSSEPKSHFHPDQICCGYPQGISQAQACSHGCQKDGQGRQGHLPLRVQPLFCSSAVCYPSCMWSRQVLEEERTETFLKQGSPHAVSPLSPMLQQGFQGIQAPAKQSLNHIPRSNPNKFTGSPSQHLTESLLRSVAGATCAVKGLFLRSPLEKLIQHKIYSKQF